MCSATSCTALRSETCLVGLFVGRVCSTSGRCCAAPPVPLPPRSLLLAVSVLLDCAQEEEDVLLKSIVHKFDFMTVRDQKYTDARSHRAGPYSN